jgi:hypothetical protein
MTRFLVVLGIVLLVAAAIYRGAVFLFSHALTPDPYPEFMSDYLQMRRDYVQMRRSPPTNQEDERTFSEFVAKTFPIGSNAKDAIAQAGRGGFRQITSTSHSVQLLWTRRAVICHEDYSIIIDQSADGMVAKATGRRHVICL